LDVRALYLLEKDKFITEKTKICIKLPVNKKDVQIQPKIILKEKRKI
jgi:hypothetical protein